MCHATIWHLCLVLLAPRFGSTRRRGVSVTPDRLVAMTSLRRAADNWTRDAPVVWAMYVFNDPPPQCS